MPNQNSTIAVVLAAAAIFLLGCDARAEPAAEQATPVVAEASEATPQPKIVFEETFHDFGVITDTDPVSYEFVFWNRGDAELKFGAIKVSGRGTIPLAKYSYQPGERGVIPVTFKPKGRTGHQAKSIRVETNDPQNRIINLRISSDIFATVSVDPRVIRFDQIESGDAKTVTATVRCRGKVFIVTDVEINGPYASAEILDIEPIVLGGIFATLTRVKVTIHEDAPLGWLDRRITIHTNNPNKPTIEAPIWANVLGPIEIQPAKLPLGVVRAGVPFRREIRLVSRESERFRMTRWKIDCDFGALDIQVKAADETPEEGASILRLIVTGTGPDRIGKLNGAIIIQTSMDNRPINIPFHCVVRPSR